MADVEPKKSFKLNMTPYVSGKFDSTLWYYTFGQKIALQTAKIKDYENDEIYAVVFDAENPKLGLWGHRQVDETFIIYSDELKEGVNVFNGESTIEVHYYDTSGTTQAFLS